MAGLVALSAGSAGASDIVPMKNLKFGSSGAKKGTPLRDTIHMGPDVDLDGFRVKLDNGRVVPFKSLTRKQTQVFRTGKLIRKGRIGASGLRLKSRRGSKAKGGSVRLMSHTPVIGEIRRWRALDFEFGFLYGKNYTFRGMGDKIEIWVASETQRAPVIDPTAPFATGTNFIDGDCRNGVRTQVSDAQVAHLINEFDTNMYPIESAAFSVKPFRDGVGGEAPSPVYHPEGEGDNVVVLVDNVRDDNFYDINNTLGFSYVAGFYSSDLDDRTNRTIMTIDSFDWLHRTGANPPHEPVPGNNCTSAPARPFLYEGVFAHEYQHLLEQYEDPDEGTWLNEGLSDWAQTITGYVNPSLPITDVGFDSHTQCFLGYLGVQTPANPNPRAGGPENSLTNWEDQGDGEILCDYGAAYTLMEYIHGQYGTSFMTSLHRGDANGFAGLQESLDTIRRGHRGDDDDDDDDDGHRTTSSQDVVHNWAAMVALDGVLDDRRGRHFDFEGSGHLKASQLRAPTLDATINWDTTHAYSTPGAPPNGSDYIRLRNSSGGYLTGKQLHSLGFNGASTHPSLPVEWVVDANPPGQAGDAALYSGPEANNADRAIVRPVAVPAGSPTLTFNSRWNTEEGWDFNFVQVSTDGGASYKSIDCTDTVHDDPAHPFPAIAPIKAQLPGFHADSAGWKAEECSLAGYAGQPILLSFRSMTDPSVLGTDPAIPSGFWVDDVAVSGAPISDGSSLTGWQSPTQIRPTPIEGFTLQLVSYRSNGKGEVGLARVTLNSNHDAALSGKKLDKLIDDKADVVAAIVMYDEATESIQQYAQYMLTVNGVVQPGGA